jgi:hypothetical protein
MRQPGGAFDSHINLHNYREGKIALPQKSLLDTVSTDRIQVGAQFKLIANGNRDVRSRRLFPKLPCLLRSRNTHYSIYYLAEPCTRIRRAHIFRCLPFEYPAFLVWLDARAQHSQWSRRGAHHDRPLLLSQSDRHRLV